MSSTMPEAAGGGAGAAAMPPAPPAIGVKMVGIGSAVPEARLSNADLEKMMDTSDEWIVQRTGIHERRRCDPSKGETTSWLATKALQAALEDGRIAGEQLDLVILASVTSEMTCPATACRVAAEVGAIGAGAFDLVAACSGFVYGLNVAHAMVRSGSHRCVAVIGCDLMTSVMDYGNRGVSILFGDAAGAAILRPTDDVSRGLIAGILHADASKWWDLYLPRRERDLPAGVDPQSLMLNSLQMNGREVYRFAITTFPKLIEDTLEKAGIAAADVDMYICHQSNARMLESARERFNIPRDKLYVNIDHFGNCSGGSVPLCLSQLHQQGRCREGELVMFLGFGGGLTWASSLWRM